ncbi:MAG TPA: VCBS domain-containing protein [Bradyrhizobium sp.]|nr:VCBS domain-containing protein [Bradyrhizobium sp.]
MTNHAPTFTGSSASGSFSEFSNTTDSTALHTLTGTMNFKDSDHSDTHTTSASLHSAALSSGTIIPSTSLAHFQSAMSSQITSDSNGTGKLKWLFSDADEDFDFLAKDQVLTLTYDIQVSDNHGGTATQTVVVTVTGTDDKAVINVTPVVTVTEQADTTLSLTPDIATIALNFTDDDLTNTGHTATVVAASATGNTSGLIFGSAELMSFYHVDSVVKASGSSAGTINTTFQAADLAFDYLAAGEHLDITYTVQLDDHAGGVSTQNVQVTVIGTNDKPIYISGPQSAHFIEDQDANSSGNLAAHGDLFFTDIDLSDTHNVSTTVSAMRSGGGAIPLTDAQLLAAFSTSLEDSTHHVLGEVDWDFTLQNSATSFLNGGETLTLTYHVAVNDPAGGSATQDVTVTIVGTNHPVMITSGAESAEAFELADTTGSAAIDTTTTVPAGTLDFTDTDTGDTHTVTATLTSTSGAAVPAATQADLAAAVTTTLHDSTGTGTGSVDWNFNIADQDLDYLAAGETLTVNYDIKVSDATTSSIQTVSVVLTGANDAPLISSGLQSGSVAEQAGMTGSTSLDTTSPDPTGTLSFTDVDLSDAHSVNIAVSSAVWSSGGDVPGATQADLQAALLTTLHDSTGSGAGGVDWTFSIQDKDLDFLSAGETMTVTYDVTVIDGSGASSTQQVTVTATGAADTLLVNPLMAPLTDTSVQDDGNVVASGNLIADAGDSPGDGANVLTVSEFDGQPVVGTVTIAGTYGTLIVNDTGDYVYVANAAVDPLREGDNPTEVFNFTVSDSFGHNEPTTVTFNVTGANDTPRITSADAVGSMTEDAGPTIAVNGGFETGDLTGWSSSSVTADILGIGGELGNYTARLSSSGFLEQDIATMAGQHYKLSFYVAGDPDASSDHLNVYWDGEQILGQTDVALGFTHYTFDVVGDSLDPTTQLFFDFAGDGSGLLVDGVKLEPTPGAATESSSGTIAFSDAETADTHTGSFSPQGADYVGAFTLDPATEASGSGSLGWHFSVNNSDIQFLAQGQTLTQTYSVFVTDDHGASVEQDVTIAINGSNDTPTAVNETVITDVGAGGTVAIQPWALAANDTDPDTTDHVFVNNVFSGSGGSAGFGFFTDDATPGGSFTYNSSDGIAISNTATATVVNNAVTATTLTGTSGDDIIIATNGAESLSGGGGNDVLIGNDGAHTLTGGAGNDNFAFLQSSNGLGTITDFNNTTQQDHIVVSASGYGGGLTANMDVTPVFESSGDDQFSGFGAVFHFDTANETLYFSSDGTTSSAIALAQVQAGVTINPHDLLIV